MNRYASLIFVALLILLATATLICASASESFRYTISGTFSIEQRSSISVKSASYSMKPEASYMVKQAISVESNGYNIGAVLECIYEEGCRLYDHEGNILVEPTHPWTIDVLSYRLPIVYVLLSSQSPIIVIINDSNLVSWILGNGSVAVAIGSQALQPTDFDVYNVTEGERTYVELVLNVVPSDPYGFIYLYFGTGSGNLIEQVQTKSSLDPATEIVDPCSIVQLRNQFVTPTTTATSTSRFTFSWSISFTIPSFSVPEPTFGVETPELQTWRSILMLGLFLGLYIIYTRLEIGPFQALAMSGAISFVISFILFGFDWVSAVLLTLTLAGITAWKLLGR